MVSVGDIPSLTRAGFLAPCRVFSVPGADIDSIHARGGDYIPIEAEGAMFRSAITGNIIEHWQRLASGRKTVLFATTKRHAEGCRNSFLDAGINAEFVHSGTPQKEAAEIFQRWMTGDVDVLCNVNIVAMGFDFPQISCVIDAAPTLSTARWLQRCGRAMRGVEGTTDAIVLDHAGNALTHGLPTMERTWHLDSGINNRKSAGGGGLGVRCEKCFCVFTGESCPECGTVPPKKKQQDMRVIDRALKEVDPYQLPVDIVNARKFYRQMLIVASKKRTKSGRAYNAHGWAWHQTEAKFGKELTGVAIFKRL
jgi:superfamily II DNA or RNA helicase